MLHEIVNLSKNTVHSKVDTIPTVKSEVIDDKIFVVVILLFAVTSFIINNSRISHCKYIFFQIQNLYSNSVASAG